MPIDLIESNPMLKKPLLAVLTLCKEHPEYDRVEIEEAAAQDWKDSFSQSPAVCVDILIRNDALIEQVYADGEPYEGTLEDMQLDPNISEDTVATSRLTVTEIGDELVEAYRPEATIAALFEEKSKYADVFKAVIEACSAKDGCSRMDLEAAINEFPQLKPDPATRQTKVYPQFFIDALETADAIAWNGAWCATDAGRSYLETATA